jgi:hypothetical protein
MKNTFKYAKAGLWAGLLLTGWVSGVRATEIVGFTGAFAPDQWDLQPDQGTTAFVNSGTQLDIVGPTGNFYPSYDAVSVTGPAAPLDVTFPVTFSWTFNAGDAEDANVSVSWAGEPGGNPLLLASGGPGSSDSGTLSLDLTQGDTLSIVLDSDVTGAGKQPASFDITGFSQTVPDATPWVEASLLLPFLMRRWLPVARRQG